MNNFHTLHAKLITDGQTKLLSFHEKKGSPTINRIRYEIDEAKGLMPEIEARLKQACHGSKLHSLELMGNEADGLHIRLTIIKPERLRGASGNTDKYHLAA